MTSVAKAHETPDVDSASSSMFLKLCVCSIRSILCGLFLLNHVQIFSLDQTIKAWERATFLGLPILELRIRF